MIISFSLLTEVASSLLQGKQLSHQYIEDINSSLSYFQHQSTIIWFLISFMLISMKMVMYKFGRGFLFGIANLPLGFEIQKNTCVIFEVLSLLFWLLIPTYFVTTFLLGWSYSPSWVTYQGLISKFLYSWSLGGVTGFCIGFGIKRFVSLRYEPYCSKWIDSGKRNTSTSLSDIRDVYHSMTKPFSFDPVGFFKEDKMFFGLDEREKPIYLDWSKFQKSHVQVMGCTGSGKGVISICLLSQVLLNGGSTVVFEPKQGGDEWAPHVLRNICKQFNKGFHLIDLQALTPQINLLQDISPEQLDQLLQAGMGIEDKGGDGDYYRLKDRKAAREGSYFAEKAQNFPHLQYLMQKELPEHLKVADSFSDKLEMICNITSVQTSDGLNLKGAIEKGDCIYIIGSPDRAQIKLLQRMVLLRIKQLVEHRDRLVEHRHVTIFIDEVKYFLTRPVLDSLAMIRDHQCNLILAHQAPGDLYDVPKDIDGQACYACVTNNTNLKLIYKINDDKDRKMAASLTGAKVIRRDSKEVLTNSGMGELIETDKKHTMDMQVPLYDENFFAALNERVGVLLGVGVAKLCFTSPIQTTKQSLELSPAAYCEKYGGSNEDVSDLKQPRSPTQKRNDTKPDIQSNDADEEESFIQFFDSSITESEEHQ